MEKFKKEDPKKYNESLKDLPKRIIRAYFQTHSQKRKSDKKNHQQ